MLAYITQCICCRAEQTHEECCEVRMHPWHATRGRPGLKLKLKFWFKVLCAASREDILIKRRAIFIGWFLYAWKNWIKKQKLTLKGQFYTLFYFCLYVADPATFLAGTLFSSENSLFTEHIFLSSKCLLVDTLNISILCFNLFSKTARRPFKMGSLHLTSLHGKLCVWQMARHGCPFVATKHIWQEFFLFYSMPVFCRAQTLTHTHTHTPQQSRGHTNMTSGGRCPWVSMISARLPPSTCQGDKCVCAFVYFPQDNIFQQKGHKCSLEGKGNLFQ